MAQERSLPDPENTGNRALRSNFEGLGLEEYREIYKNSISDREKFWSVQAAEIKWDHPFSRVFSEDLKTASVEWFVDGMINASWNALDYHIKPENENQPSLVYYCSGENSKTFSRIELFNAVIRTAAALEAKGISYGDRIFLYLPDCPESIILMLAAARIGAIYVPVPYYFTSEIAAEIAVNCDASIVFADPTSRDSSYASRASEIIKKSPAASVTLNGHEGAEDYETFIGRIAEPPTGEYNSMDSEHPLFITYANSATGIPRGSVLPSGGYAVQAKYSFKSIFPSETECVLCTLPLATGAGQCYGLWGPLLNGKCIAVCAEGEKPDTGILQKILLEFNSVALMTSPHYLADLKSSIGEKRVDSERSFSAVAVSGDMLTPRLITFAGQTLSSGTDKILNLWVQSESGVSLINTYPQSELNHPGALGLASPGVEPLVVNNFGEICRTNESGQLVFRSSWPSMIRTVWGQFDRYKDIYFNRLPGYFVTNDGVRIDNDGFFWFMGRLDDVIKIRGQSLATSEIEAILITHPAIAEAAVVSVRGDREDTPIAFICMRDHDTDFDPSALEKELSSYIVNKIGEFALPRQFVFAAELPKTRTGKVLRRILKRIAVGDISEDEDLSHVVNPGAVNELLKKKGF